MLGRAGKVSLRLCGGEGRGEEEEEEAEAEKKGKVLDIKQTGMKRQ